MCALLVRKQCWMKKFAAADASLLLLLITISWTIGDVAAADNKAASPESNDTVNSHNDQSKQLDALLFDEAEMKKIKLLAPLLGGVDFVALWLNSPLQQASLKLEKRLWNAGTFRICTDGAANFIMPLVRDENCAKPSIISGDFDSIANEAREYFHSQKVEFVETPDQDYTDMCKALKLIADQIRDEKVNTSRVVVLGGLFGRFDHVLSSLQSLLRFQVICETCDTILVDGANVVTVLSAGTTTLEFDDARHLYTGKCGVVPFVQRETIVTSKGLKWNLDKTELAFGKLISTSNEIADNKVLIKSTAPLIFTMELTEDALS